MDSVENKQQTIAEREARSAARRAALATAVAQIEAHLPDVGEPTARPVLLMLSGLPGSGKSYLARRLQPHLSATIIETDDVRHVLFPQPRYTGAENAWVYAVCHALIARLLAQGRSVIFDATNLIERKREILYHIAERTGAKLVIVRTVAPEDVIERRLLTRSQQNDPDNHSDANLAVYMKLRQTEEPIRRQHIVVDTTQDIDAAIHRILRICRT
jgi:hypothetical protein